MRRWSRSPLIAGLLLAQLGSSMVSAAAPPPAEAASPAAAAPGERRDGQVRHGTRRYGQGPLRARWAQQQLRLHFTGRRGQIVGIHTNASACVAVSLRRAGRALPRMSATAWRLPAKGRYTFTTTPRPRCDKRTALQLVKYRVRPVAVDGRRVRLSRGRAYVDLGAVTTDGKRRIHVRNWRRQTRWSAVIAPNERRVRWLRGSSIYLPVGGPVHDLSWQKGFDRGPATKPGRYLFLPRRSGRMSASTPDRVPITVDGPAATSAASSNGRERSFVFDGTAGTFLYAETQLPSGDGHVELVGPSGRSVHDFHSNSGWVLPKDGRYRLFVTASRGDADAPVAVRLRTAQWLPKLAPGGTVRVEVDATSRWVAMPLTGADAMVSLTTHNLSLPTGWQWVIDQEFTSYCGQDPRQPLGCGDDVSVILDSLNPTRSGYLYRQYSYYGVLRVAPGDQGAIELGISAASTARPR